MGVLSRTVEMEIPVQIDSDLPRYPRQAAEGEKVQA